MAGFKEKFDSLLLEFIKRRGINAIAVTGYYESSSQVWSGGCETCGNYDTEFEVDIYYVYDEAYGSRTYTYDGKFADLITELAEIDEELTDA